MKGEPPPHSIKMITHVFFEELYTNKFDNLNGKSTIKDNITNTIEKRMDNLTISTSIYNV